MPASGLDGGGAMTVQEIDQVVDYLKSLQISQMDSFNKADAAVQTALDRIANAEATIQTRILVEETALLDIREGPAQYSVRRRCRKMWMPYWAERELAQMNPPRLLVLPAPPGSRRRS